MTAIFWPVLALVGLTAIIWLLMYVRRLGEMHHKRIKPQDLATVSQAASQLKNVSAAENYTNLLEAPILFYLLCVILFFTGLVTDTQVMLAWIYVGLRAVHSLIHVTNNHVVSRWLAYVLSMVCLFGMWFLFASALLMH